MPELPMVSGDQCISALEHGGLSVEEFIKLLRG